MNEFVFVFSFLNQFFFLSGENKGSRGKWLDSFVRSFCISLFVNDIYIHQFCATFIFDFLPLKQEF
jgi:hypothetical protein